MSQAFSEKAAPLILLGIVVLACLYIAMGVLETRSLRRASDAELRILLKRWVEDGRPTEGRLIEFMKGRSDRFAVSNINIAIEGTNHQALFALKKLHSGENGTLFICTNGTTILWVPQHPPHIWDQPRIRN